MAYQELVAKAFEFLEKDFGFKIRADSNSVEHTEYVKDPLSIDIWHGHGEIDVYFEVSLLFAKKHEVFRPFISRRFSWFEVMCELDSTAKKSWREQYTNLGDYITSPQQALNYISLCAEFIKRYCTPVLCGDLTVLEIITLERRSHA